MFRPDGIKLAQELGTKDGALNQDHAKEFVVQFQGLRPIFNPTTSTAQAEWLRDSDTTTLDRWTNDLRATEDALIQHRPAWQITLALLGVFLIETESFILLYQLQGVTGITRIVLAAATAATSIVLPHAVKLALKAWEQHQ